MAAIALCYAGLCCEGLDRHLRRATRLLVRELDRQILADGGHASRNPRIVVDLLFDLLPLRQMYASREVDTPEVLLNAIDRMLPMVRMFRHGDGTLSHFNGMGVTAADHLATLLTYDDMRSQPIHRAPYSGYERLEAGRSLLVADVGRLPPTRLSQEAGAGTLSFEFSSGPQRIVVNCGTPCIANDAHRPGRPLVGGPFHGVDRRGLVEPVRGRQGPLARPRPRPLAPAPHRPGGARRARDACTTERTERDRVQSLSASHDAYRRRFGVVHERRWQLSPDGHRLEGEDTFRGDTPIAARTEALIRFHLAPGIRASRRPGRPGRHAGPAQPGGLAVRGQSRRGLRGGQHLPRHRRRHAPHGADRPGGAADRDLQRALALRAPDPRAPGAPDGAGPELL